MLLSCSVDKSIGVWDGRRCMAVATAIAMAAPVAIALDLQVLQVGLSSHRHAIHPVLLRVFIRAARPTRKHSHTHARTHAHFIIRAAHPTYFKC